MSTSKPTEFVEARRESSSFLMAAERRCLLWLAARLPAWISSDHLTVLALVAMAGAGASFWAARFNRVWLVGVVVSLAVNWFGDSLDGTLARVRRQPRPRYGFYVDHVVDCFGVLFLIGGMALSGFMHPLVAAGLLAAYFMLSIEIYLATYCLTVFRLSFWKMGPTELRLVLAVGALALMRDPHVDVLGGHFKLFDVSGVLAIAGIVAVLLVSVFTNTRALYRAEPLVRVGSTPSGRGTGRRFVIFNVVGAAGVAVQLGMLWALTQGAGVHDLVATSVAVEAAVLHNFFWHGSWTWSDRPAGAGLVIRRLVRFNLTTGLVSIAGNIALTGVLVQLGLHVVVANAASIVACSAVNFAVNHRFVFAPAISVLLVAGNPLQANAATLSPAAVAAFDRDVRAVEARLDEERAGRAPFLWVDRLPGGQPREARARMARGEIVVHRLSSAHPSSSWVDAMFHHWMATVFIPGTRLDQVVGLMQGYDDYANVYRPAVSRSRLIARDRDGFTVALRLFTKKVISVTLDTEQRVAYLAVVHPSRMQVRSVGTRIAEVEDAGEPDEREAPIGRDNGFLWRFNNYCALEENGEGTYVQCESLSLTRDTPFGLGWLVGPMVTSIPRESLRFTLEAMRRALTARADRHAEASVRGGAIGLIGRIDGPGFGTCLPGERFLHRPHHAAVDRIAGDGAELDEGSQLCEIRAALVGTVADVPFLVHQHARQQSQGAPVFALVRRILHEAERRPLRQQVDSRVAGPDEGVGVERDFGRPRVHEDNTGKRSRVSSQDVEYAHQYSCGAPHGQPPTCRLAPLYCAESSPQLVLQVVIRDAGVFAHAGVPPSVACSTHRWSHRTGRSTASPIVS